MLEARRIALAYERSKQTWRSVVDEDRERRIAEAREPHALKRAQLFELAQQKLDAEEDEDEQEAGETRLEMGPDWEQQQLPFGEGLAVTPPDRPANRVGL